MRLISSLWLAAVAAQDWQSLCRFGTCPFFVEGGDLPRIMRSCGQWKVHDFCSIDPHRKLTSLTRTRTKKWWHDSFGTWGDFQNCKRVKAARKRFCTHRFRKMWVVAFASFKDIKDHKSTPLLRLSALHIVFASLDVKQRASKKSQFERHDGLLLCLIFFAAENQKCPSCRSLP